MSVADPVPSVEPIPAPPESRAVGPVLSYVVTLASPIVVMGPLIVFAFHGDTWWAIGGFVAWLFGIGFLADRIDEAARRPDATPMQKLLDKIRRYMTHS